MASRTTVGIGIPGAGEVVTSVVVATGIGTMIGGSAVDQRVPSVATRPKMVEAMEVTVVAPVVAMATTTIATAMDRVVSVLPPTRWVHSVIKISRAPLSLGQCRGPLRMA